MPQRKTKNSTGAHGRLFFFFFQRHFFLFKPLFGALRFCPSLPPPLPLASARQAGRPALKDLLPPITWGDFFDISTIVYEKAEWPINGQKILVLLGLCVQIAMLIPTRP